MILYTLVKTLRPEAMQQIYLYHCQGKHKLVRDFKKVNGKTIVTILAQHPKTILVLVTSQTRNCQNPLTLTKKGPL